MASRFRIAVTVSPDLYETIARLSKVSGQSMSSIVGEVAESTAEPLKRLADILEAAKRANDSRLEGLREAAAAMESRLAPMAARVNQVLGETLTELQTAAGGEAVSASPRRRRNPRPSNTGVRSTRTTHGTGGGS